MNRTLSTVLICGSLLAGVAAAQNPAVFVPARAQEIYRVLVNPGDLLLESIQSAIDRNGIRDGEVLVTSGSVSQCTYHFVTSAAAVPKNEYKTVNGAFEILNAGGLIADGEPHIHITLAPPGGNAFGGHLEKGCKVLYLAEITLIRFAGAPLTRVGNAQGVALLQARPVAEASASAAMPVIFDTDMGNDVDDALALGILHALSDRGECRLIGVTLTNANPAAVPFVRLVNRFYGRGELPVGEALRHVSDGDHDNYLSATLRSAPAEYRESGGEPPAEPAVALLRRLLARSSAKVTIVQVGFSTNLQALLHSAPDAISPLSGIELVKEKVQTLSVMAGNFVETTPEYNVKLDIGAAREVFERWPTPILFSGFEIGRELLYPASSIEHDFRYVPWHPVAAAYRAYNRMPYARPTWDLTAALEGVRGDHGYFGRSLKGRVRVAENGTTRFEPGEGDRQYLKMEPGARERILEALTLLASEPPR